MADGAFSIASSVVGPVAMQPGSASTCTIVLRRRGPGSRERAKRLGALIERPRRTGAGGRVRGGGIGGPTAADALRGRLDRRHRIILVEREAEQVFAPSLLWLMVGQRRPAAISRPLAKLLRPGIGIVRSEGRGLDPSATRA